ncbi:MAG TPA: hypothetical protein VNM40_01950 [Candidatus Paceibacterota bacterium]|nr:hypothetical protein [Candidatus Paceibacterota bacterium]
MASRRLKERAWQLREQGMSISDIAHTLSASKSTVSYWCRDISLSKIQQQLLAAKQHQAGMLGRLRAAEQKRAARLNDISRAR